MPQPDESGTEWRLPRDDLLPGGDGVLVPAGELPDAQAGDIVRYAERETGRERHGRIVGLIEQDGNQVLAIEVLGPGDDEAEGDPPEADE